MISPRPVACYGRTSTDEQAERQSVLGQLDFLRQYTALMELTVAGEYVDDGISGGIPLARRPAGQRLLADAKSGVFGEVLVYRLDRLGRSLRALIDADSELSAAGVTIRSATEPFDTAQPIGRFIFNLLGSMAELERSTISERTTMGRDRVARAGTWTAGWIPWGYVKTDTGQLAPSAEIVPQLGISAASALTDLYTRIAGGSTATAEARRLNSLGVLPIATSALGQRVQRSPRWTTSRVAAIVRNPVYGGVLRLKSRHGVVESECAALILPALWQMANDQITSNRRLPNDPDRQPYILRGLLTCAHCGGAYTGGSSNSYRYYQCVGASRGHLEPSERCHGRRMRADRLEAEVWSAVVAFARDPLPYLAEAREHAVPVVEDDRARRDTLATALAAKESEADRVLTMLRLGHASADQVGRQLDAIGRETRVLRELVASLEVRAQLAEQEVARRADLPAFLLRIQDALDADVLDAGQRQEAIRYAVRRIVVMTGTDETGRVRPVARVEWAI